VSIPCTKDAKRFLVTDTDTLTQKQLTDLHEQLEVLQKRDEDNAIRLHNSYFTTTQIRSDRDGLMQELSREPARRAEHALRLQNTIDRIRGEGEGVRKALEECRGELKDARERDVGTVEGMWAAYAKPVKIGPLPLKDAQVQRKRRTREEEGNTEDAQHGKLSGEMLVLGSRCL
jgi:hypothetical protein